MFDDPQGSSNRRFGLWHYISGAIVIGLLIWLMVHVWHKYHDNVSDGAPAATDAGQTSTNATPATEKDPLIIDDDTKESDKPVGIIYILYDSNPAAGEDITTHRYPRETAAWRAFDEQARQHYPELLQNMHVIYSGAADENSSYEYLIEIQYYRPCQHGACTK